MGRSTGESSRYVPTNALARRDARMDILNGITTSVTGSSRLQGVVARLMASHATATQDTTGRCTCTGGSGHCLGCESIPVYHKRTRVGGLDGANGAPGTPAILLLHHGLEGPPGSSSIIVRSKNGEETTYGGRWRLELKGFDLDDGNGDGIFEPGEHLFIRRIQVRNSG
jgi:hypothetical protein